VIPRGAGLGTVEPVAIEVREPTVDLASGACPDDAVPQLITCLDELVRAGIRFCSWKSNLHVRAALAGETDVDLLLDRRDATRFAEIAATHGLKVVVPARDAVFPGMQHLLGLDGGTGRLFHLHVHYQLVLGEKHVKNYRVPLEAAFLSGRRSLDGVPVPRPELELSVLAARALLKYRARDVVKDVLQVRSPGLPAEIQAEIAWLRERTTPEAVGEALESCGDVPPADVVRRLVDTAVRDPRAGFTLVRLRRRLRLALRDCRRRSRVRAGAGYLAATWRYRSRARMRGAPDQGLTPEGGGTTIALVGADGSGKSTLADAAARWLSWKLETRVHYMGSKEPSRPTSGLYVVFRALRRGHRGASRRLRADSPIVRGLAGGRDTALALHHLFVGRDRARHYRTARRDAQAGRVVLFDRFPLAHLSRQPEHRLLDGPQIATLLGSSPGRVPARLAAAEERIYRRFRLPDHLVVLDVDPEVAARRKPDHQPEVIRAKSRAVVELGRLAEASGTPVTWIDANRPLAAVLLDVKAGLWDAL
jgi:thymidylate kinase